MNTKLLFFEKKFVNEDLEDFLFLIFFLLDFRISMVNFFLKMCGPRKRSKELFLYLMEQTCEHTHTRPAHCWNID